MSHNSTVILVVRPLWGRSHVDALPPQVKTRGYHSVTPLGSFLDSSGSFLDSSLCHQIYYYQKSCPLLFGLSFLKTNSIVLKQLKQQGTTYRTIEQRSLDLQHGSNLVAGGRECDDKAFGSLAGFHLAITKECNAADLAAIGVAFAQ